MLEPRPITSSNPTHVLEIAQLVSLLEPAAAVATSRLNFWLWLWERLFSMLTFLEAASVVRAVVSVQVGQHVSSAGAEQVFSGLANGGIQGDEGEDEEAEGAGVDVNEAHGDDGEWEDANWSIV